MNLESDWSIEHRGLMADGGVGGIQIPDLPVGLPTRPNTLDILDCQA